MTVIQSNEVRFEQNDQSITLFEANITTYISGHNGAAKALFTFMYSDIVQIICKPPIF